MSETTGRYESHAEGDVSDAFRVGVAEAKGKFSALVEGVQHRGEHYVIERHGKPAAALVSVDELELVEAARRDPSEGNDGLTGLIGLFGDLMSDDEIDDMVDAIYEDRARDELREVDSSDWFA
ncbi:MAG: type II toxin-antitoxin system Phd/YefM family antitoxin [Chloroflexi bacterium]|nr:type II toxin-antitoxin system Phd/YefM family antitoxin [Chloroflexota bacterium]